MTRRQRLRSTCGHAAVRSADTEKRGRDSFGAPRARASGIDRIYVDQTAVFVPGRGKKEEERKGGGEEEKEKPRE